jgi:hypothetical protein
MASGINSTFRQVGIATGIALLGSLFSSQVKDSVIHQVTAVPGLAGHGSQIASAIQGGQAGQAISHLPPALRGPAEIITKTAFTTALDRILLVGAVLALAAAVICFLTIRSKDFAQATSSH